MLFAYSSNGMLTTCACRARWSLPTTGENRCGQLRESNIISSYVIIAGRLLVILSSTIHRTNFDLNVLLRTPISMILKITPLDEEDGVLWRYDQLGFLTLFRIVSAPVSTLPTRFCGWQSLRLLRQLKSAELSMNPVKRLYRFLNTFLLVLRELMTFSLAINRTVEMLFFLVNWNHSLMTYAPARRRPHPCYAMPSWTRRDFLTTSPPFFYHAAFWSNIALNSWCTNEYAIVFLWHEWQSTSFESMHVDKTYCNLCIMDCLNDRMSND